HAQAAGPLQLLRRERQHAVSSDADAADQTRMEEVARPSQPARVHELGALRADARALSASRAPDHGADLEHVNRETYRQKSRMVEISLSGSGEGLGWKTYFIKSSRGYSIPRSVSIDVEPPTTLAIDERRDATVPCQRGGDDAGNPHRV